MVVVVALRQVVHAVVDSLRWDGYCVHQGVQEVPVVPCRQAGALPVVRSSMRDEDAPEVVPVSQMPGDPTLCGRAYWCTQCCHGAA